MNEYGYSEVDVNNICDNFIEHDCRHVGLITTQYVKYFKVNSGV